MKAASTPEYDAFGPWILPVSSHEQVPPVFQAHPIDFTRAHDVLKVPRDIARRDATPRSHLYDYLIALDRDGIEVLTRRGHRYSVQRISHDTVAAVDSGTELLAGRFSVQATNGSRIDVSFNAASSSVITNLADRLIGWSTDELDDLRTLEELDQDTLGYHDVGLVNGYNSLPYAHDGRRVTAAYTERVPTSHRSRIHRLLKGDTHLSGAVVGTDEQFAVVIARAEWVRHTRKPDLSLRRIVIPKHHVTSISSTPHPFLDGVVDLTVQSREARLVLTVPADQAQVTTEAFAPVRTSTA